MNVSTRELLLSYLKENYSIEKSEYTFFSNIETSNIEIEIELAYNRIILCRDIETKLKQINLSPTYQTEIISYCAIRIKEVTSQHIRAKYAQFLLLLTKNNIYAKTAIESYQSIATSYFNNANEGKNTNLYIRVLRILSELYLSYQKNKLVEFKNYIIACLEQTNNFELKLNIIGYIATSSKIFKSVDLIELPNICLDLFENLNSDNLKERALDYGIAICKKSNNIESLRIIAEHMGDLLLTKIYHDNEQNIAITHLNETIYNRAIKYFKLAKCQAKLESTHIALEKNRINHKYIKSSFTYNKDTTVRVIDCINSLVRDTLNEKINDILIPICFHNISCLLPDYKKLEAIGSRQQEYGYVSSFSCVRVDSWGNTYRTSHESYAMHLYFSEMFNRLTILYIPILFANAMNLKILNKRNFKKALNLAGFNIKITVQRPNIIDEFTLYDVFGIGLEEYLIQCKKFFSNQKKHADWRFCIDFLTPKFESIIRILASKLKIPITKQQGDEIQFITLETLLNNTMLQSVFTKDDIFLFKHTFTKEYHNIRNDVAHGLMMPNDYTHEKALLVFLCVLRLSKIIVLLSSNVSEGTNNNENNGNT